MPAQAEEDGKSEIQHAAHHTPAPMSPAPILSLCSAQLLKAQEGSTYPPPPPPLPLLDCKLTEFINNSDVRHQTSDQPWAYTLPL